MCPYSAVNDNQLYLDFIPYFINTWNKICPSVDIKIVLVSKNIPENLLKLGYENNLIFFESIDGVSTSFTSQYIRLLYPSLLSNYQGGIIITDIDMVPTQKEYYTKFIEDIPENKFVYYRGNRLDKFKGVGLSLL